MPESTGIWDLAKVVEGCIDPKHIRRVSKNSLRRFCVDVAVVGLSVRAAYLVDLFHPNHPNLKEFYESLLKRLRQTVTTHGAVFENVCIATIHQLDFDQFFFLNIDRCVALLDQIHDAKPLEQSIPGAIDSLSGSCYSDRPIYVELNPSLSISHGIPAQIWPSLCSLRLTLSEASSCEPPNMISLSPGNTSDTLVPLAGFLLEYPVVYVPISADQTVFLANEPLDLYECLIDDDVALAPADLAGTATAPEQHSLFRFSCPARSQSDDHNLSPETMSQRLRATMLQRLAGIGYRGRLNVLHRVEHLDRVAL